MMWSRNVLHIDTWWFGYEIYQQAAFLIKNCFMCVYSANVELCGFKIFSHLTDVAIRSIRKLTLCVAIALSTIRTSSWITPTARRLVSLEPINTLATPVRSVGVDALGVGHTPSVVRKNVAFVDVVTSLSAIVAASWYRWLTRGLKIIKKTLKVEALKYTWWYKICYRLKTS